MRLHFKRDFAQAAGSSVHQPEIHKTFCDLSEERFAYHFPFAIPVAPKSVVAQWMGCSQ